MPEPPAERQVPEIEKHPAVRLIPFANVDEAVADVALNMLAATPPEKVEVAVVVATKFPTVSCVPVATSAVPAAFEVMIEFGANDVEPVPPDDTASACARVSTPAVLNDDVAVVPKYAIPAESCVEDA